MQVISIDPARIEVGKRLRPADPAKVAFLVESIGRGGQDTPILVTVPDENGFCRLVAGLHRLKAIQQLGLPTIDALPKEGSAMELELAEIDENLTRSELNEIDRAVFLARRQEIYQALYPSTKAGGDRRKKPDSQPENLIAAPFAKDVAKRLGLSNATVYRSIRRASLPDNVRARLAGTWIANNGAALDELIGRGEPLSPSEQHAVLDILLEPGSRLRSVNEVLRRLRAMPAPDEAEKQLNKLKAAWKTAGSKARREFRAFIAAMEGN